MAHSLLSFWQTQRRHRWRWTVGGARAREQLLLIYLAQAPEFDRMPF
ncbi:MAG: hypothetical protein R2854_04550 [Caldilineaceae bacterium]